MIKDNLKKIVSVLVLFVLWILPCLELEIFTKTYVYFVTFILSVALMYIIKKELISFIAITLISIAVSFYNYEYLFTVLPVMLLTYAHYSISNVENKKGDTFNTGNNCTTLSFVFIIGEIVYAFIQYANIEVHRIENVFIALKLVPLFIIFFIVLAVQGRNKDNYKTVPKKKADKYVILYLTSLSGIAVSLFTFHALNGYGTQSIRTEYIFWFIFVMTMAINKDPFIEITIKRIKAAVEEIKTSCK